MLNRLPQRTQVLLLLFLLLAGPALWLQQRQPAAAPPTPVEAQSFSSQAGAIHLQQVAGGLEHPWSLAFLPDGRMLVSERPGRLRMVTPEGVVGPAIAGLPAVAANGQGGLLDVVLAPDYARTGVVYFSYSEPRDGGNGTAVARARLERDGLSGRLRDLQVVFRQQPAIDSNKHFGSRLAWAGDGSLFITLGDRGSERDRAQTLDNALGKVVRIQPDGRVPADNPFVGRAGARPEIWSYGHRNLQGAAINPSSGELWTHEHGPQGGDELNIPRAGRNYGWPVITYGREYSGLKVGDGLKAQAGMEQPIHYWVPSIAPSGMAFYTSERIPAWQGSLFVASLKFGQLARLSLDGDRVVAEERLLEGLNRRLRDVRQGPDGALYLLTDDAEGSILRLTLGKAPGP